MRSSSFRVATSGIMISGITVLPAFFCTSADGLEDGAGLHLVDLGIGDAEPAAAMAEHRVELVQLVGARLDLGHRRRRGPWPRPPCRPAVLGRNSCSGGSSRRMVTGRPAMISNSSTKSCALHRQDLGQRRAPALLVVGQDHLAHGDDAVAVEEHVLGAAKADALGAELARLGRVERRLGVGAHAQACGPRRPSPSARRSRRRARAGPSARRPA